MSIKKKNKTSTLLEKIISFYEKFGFNLIKNIEAENELETMILQLKKLI